MVITVNMHFSNLFIFIASLEIVVAIVFYLKKLSLRIIIHCNNIDIDKSINKEGDGRGCGGWFILQGKEFE